MLRSVITFGIITTVSFLCALAPGQLNPFDTGGAEEPIVEMSPGPAVPPALDRARAPAGEKEFVGGPAGPETGLHMGELPYEGYYPGMRPGATPTPTPTPFVRMVKVVTGRRVIDAVSGTLLEDIQMGQIPITQVEGKFYDDGPEGGHGDAKAGDEIYTNIEMIDKEFIGADNAELLRRFVNALLTVDRTEPREFYRLLVSTDEPLSALPKNIVLEEERDNKIARVGVDKEKRLSAWIDYLNIFRKNPDDTDSDFYSVYVPIPPELPKYPYPPGYDPVAEERAQEEMLEQGRPGYAPGMMMGEEVYGPPREGHMGSYMR